MAAFAGMCDGGPTDACVTGNIQNNKLKIEFYTIFGVKFSQNGLYAPDCTYCFVVEKQRL